MKSVHVLCAAFTFIVGCSHTAHQLENKNADLANTASSSDRTNIQTIDLSQIGHLAPKGRVQDDYNRSPVVDQLVAAGPESIPYLISKLEDETEIEGHVMDFWYKVTIGDIAFIILSDFFTDSSWENTTIPEIGWDQMLERRNRDITGEQVLRE